MSTFIEKLWTEYPIPRSASIWNPSSGEDAEVDFSALIESAVDELGSDLFVTEHKQAYGMTTFMPEDTVSIICAKLNQPFQGNRQVKFTYDRSTNAVHLRYWPSIISYKRKFKVEDLETVCGDELRYCKAYILWKMADKELQVLKAVKLDTDNGEFDLSVLKEFADTSYDRYNKMKEDILIYGANN